MSAAANLPGRLGQYRVRGRVGFDRNAEILVAREEGPLGFSREVTLRSVARDPAATTWGEIELAREARICERLDHPAIVRVVELFTAGDRLVLALEGAEGISLESVLASDVSLSDAACAYILATVASALAYAHDKSLIHRAVAPDAIVIGEGGTVKLSSFGVARSLESTPDSAVSLLDVRARVISPEEAGGGASTTKSDVWALGVLALQLFAREDAASVASRAASFRAPRLSSLRRDLPREVCAAVDAALVIDAKRRTITCAEFAKWIERVMDLDSGRSELAEHIELAFEATPDAQGTPRHSRTIRRQAASRRRLRRARLDVGDLEEVEELEELDLEPIEDEPISIEPIVDAPVVIAETPIVFTPIVVVATPKRRRSFAHVPSRLLLAATLIAALATIAHRTRNNAIIPVSKAEAEPEEQVINGNACAAADPHCALDPRPAPVIPPPARMLPPELGWVHVHSNGTVGQVFVAARPWGDPEKTIAVPCGRYYVNVARADSRGGWRGWMNIGQFINVPCDGTVAEITLARPAESYETPSARSKIASTWRSTWPMSKQ